MYKNYGMRFIKKCAFGFLCLWELIFSIMTNSLFVVNSFEMKLVHHWLGFTLACHWQSCQWIIVGKWIFFDENIVGHTHSLWNFVFWLTLKNIEKKNLLPLNNHSCLAYCWGFRRNVFFYRIKIKQKVSLELSKSTDKKNENLCFTKSKQRKTLQPILNLSKAILFGPLQ